MRKWEDIVKDKLEEPDGALPESVFDEFHVRFDGAESARTARRFPLVWAIVPALAATGPAGARGPGPASGRYKSRIPGGHATNPTGVSQEGIGPASVRCPRITVHGRKSDGGAGNT